ncbi:MAG TPA: UDP-N-acetylmuramate dehydrogenase [Kiritimatiellia bacterium]|nr:UDP-N-acetylmuramate dehydrogenase [Kiritimatiellia bacterium]
MDDLTLQENVPLAPLTSFGVGGCARYWVPIASSAQVPLAIRYAIKQNVPYVVMGGGSNLVVSDEGFGGVVLAMMQKGRTILEESSTDVLIRVEAGERWDEVVGFCVGRGWWGVENLSLIPGTVGAVPIQNVGAYGQEASDTLDSVEAWDTAEEKVVTLSRDECRFGYRSSRFNAIDPGRYVILAVTFRLGKSGEPVLTHAAVRNRVEAMESAALDVQRMRDVVISLRSDGRLPDVRRIGNAGSFFKNLFLSPDAFDAMIARVKHQLGEEAATKLAADGRRFAGPGGYKLPAGLLISCCGFAHERVGGAALHHSNPTIMINENGRATASDLRHLASRILNGVEQMSGMRLQIEPQPLGMTWP